jgi:hypothetical protein
MQAISLTFTASSIAGPLVAGGAMKLLGTDALMWQLASLSAALFVYVVGMGHGAKRFGKPPSAG